MANRRKNRPKLVVPWYQQMQDSWCAPAALKEMLEPWEIVVEQEHLARLLKTTKAGTDTKMVKKVLSMFGLNYRSHVQGTYRMIDRALDQLKPVLIAYREPDTEEPHYAVVTKLTSKTILMQDPWMGEDWRMRRADFTPRWRNQNRWMLVIHGRRKGPTKK